MKYEGSYQPMPGATTGKNKGVQRYLRSVRAAEAELRNSKTPTERRRVTREPYETRPGRTGTSKRTEINRASRKRKARRAPVAK